MKRHRRRQPLKPRVSPSVLDRINPHAAGIDCGSAEHFVAVPPDRDPTPIRSFPTFTTDLHRLADWFTACRITSVATEATGVYWIPVFEILEARGFAVILVNARHVKNVPGRKSDVSDPALTEHVLKSVLVKAPEHFNVATPGLVLELVGKLQRPLFDALCSAILVRPGAPELDALEILVRGRISFLHESLTPRRKGTSRRTRTTSARRTRAQGRMWCHPE